MSVVFWLAPAVLAGAQANRDEPITAEFAQKTFAKVDERVRKYFYDGAAMQTWQGAVNAHKATILKSRTLVALDRSINDALHMLKASHTQFVTPNDETFYFLKALFSSHSRDDKNFSNPPKIDYVGAITGGVNCAAHEVRYVLDGSPAEAAGVKIGDEIVSVNALPYVGQLSFRGLSGKPVSLKLRRGGEEVAVSVKPVLRNDYEAYIEAIGKSVRINKVGNTKVGYVHVWCGGSGDSHDAIEQALDRVKETDGLIFDLRDGYGGNFFEDLDYFYRPPDAYPVFTTLSRNGKKFTSFMAYSKPLVVLINGGSRSGKELLAYSLKRTKRATLVGETTAGAVLAGRLFNINDRAALYLAVANGKVGPQDEVLEGKGVAPDVEVKETCAERGKKDNQYEEALKIVMEKITNRAP